MKMRNRGAHIRVAGVSHRYPNAGEQALAGIDLEIQPGESVAMVGRSGCGKSTLLHLMCGLSRPVTGQVEIDGAVVRGPSPEWIMMFQSPSLYPWMTVGKNIGLGLEFAGRKSEIAARVEELLDLVQMPGMQTRNVQDLSGGQQQRVALARSLATRPQVLLLDEPFSALDTFTRHALQRDVRQIATQLQITMVFVTHDVNEAVLMADRAVLMQARPGRIAAQMPITPDEPYAGGEPVFTQARTKLMAAYQQIADDAEPVSMESNPERTPIKRVA